MRGGRVGEAASIEIFRVDTPERIAEALPAPDEEPPRAGRWRWIVPLLVVAMIAVAMLWPAEDHAATAPAPLPATTAPPAVIGTSAESTSTLLLPAVPVGMLQGSADRSAGRSTPGTAEVWATPGSTFTHGSWFIVQVVPGDAVGSGDRRVWINDTVVVIGADHGVRRLSYALAGAGGAQSTVHLWARMSDADLIALARQVVIRNGIVTSIGAAARDHVLVARLDDAQSGGDLWGHGPNGVELAYVGATTDEQLRVSIAPLTPDRRDLGRFLLTRTTRLASGSTGWYGYLGGDKSTVVLTLQYERAGQLVTIETLRALGGAVAVADTIHPASSDEWAHVSAEHHLRTDPYAVQMTAAVGTLTDGRGWTLTAGSDRQRTTLTLIGYTGSPSSAPTAQVEAVAAPTILAVADEQATYLLGVATPDTALASLEVDVGGRTIRSAPAAGAVHLWGTWNTWGVGFSEPGPWTARLIAADGQVLATLTGDG